MIKEKIEENEKTNATQIVKLLDNNGSKILRMSVIRARMTLGYVQLPRHLVHTVRCYKA